MKNKLYLLILLLPIFFFAHLAQAASIYTASSASNVNVNQSFTVTINTNTEGAYINNAEGIVSFPNDLLSVSSINSSDSIFSMWVEQPKFSNVAGTITFNGGIPTPGFIGSRGKILSITFQAKKAGTAIISFSSANVFANDGMGTDITSGKTGSTINIGNVVVKTPPPVKVVPKKKTESDITPPTNLKVIPFITADDFVSLKISSVDKESGLDKYQISIDGKVVSEVEADVNPITVILPATIAGSHEVSVIAYDNAGNLTEKIVPFQFPEMKAPIIVEYPTSIKKGEVIKISGTSYPDTNVRIFMDNGEALPKSYLVNTDDAGKFSFTSDFINTVGTLSFWADAERASNVISPISEKYFVVVNNTPFINLSLWMIHILLICIPILLLLILIFYIIYHAYHKLRKMRRRLLTDMKQTEDESHKIFGLLNEDVKQSIKIFKKKDIKERLTADDKETVDSLSKDVEEAEEYFQKRFKNIREKDL